MSTFLALVIGLAISHYLLHKLDGANPLDRRVEAYFNQVIGALVFMISYQVTQNVWL